MNLKFLAACTLVIGSITCASPQHANVDGQEAPQQWSGSDGKINRVVSFRTGSYTEWMSFWRAQCGKTTPPTINFLKYEVVGLVLPKSRSALAFKFDLNSVADTVERITIDFRAVPADEANPIGDGSRYAFTLLPKSERAVVFQAGEESKVEGALIEGELVAEPLLVDGHNVFPRMPMVPSGSASTGASHGINHLTIKGEPITVSRGQTGYSLAHIAVVPDPALEAMLVASGNPAPGADGWSDDQFVQSTYFEYHTKEWVIRPSFTFDGRQQTIAASGKVFDLAKGNFIQIDIDAVGGIRAKQYSLIDTERATSGMDRVIAKFNELMRDED